MHAIPVHLSAHRGYIESPQSIVPEPLNGLEHYFDLRWAVFGVKLGFEKTYKDHWDDSTTCTFVLVVEDGIVVGGCRLITLTARELLELLVSDYELNGKRRPIEPQFIERILARTKPHSRITIVGREVIKQEKVCTRSRTHALHLGIVQALSGIGVDFAYAAVDHEKKHLKVLQRLHRPGQIFSAVGEDPVWFETPGGPRIPHDLVSMHVENWKRKYGIGDLPPSASETPRLHSPYPAIPREHHYALA